MREDEPQEIQTLLSACGVDHAALSAVVRQALECSSVDIVDVQGGPIYGGTSSSGQGVAGVYRLTGVGRDFQRDLTWSLIFKIIGVTDATRDPSGPWYWKRELLAYQSKQLEQLPGPLRAARCFGTVEISDTLTGLWFEDIVDDIGSHWPLERYALTAHHLGQFNAAYINSSALASWSWLGHGWLRRLVEQEGHRSVTLLREYQNHSLVAQIYTKESIEQIVRLWHEHGPWLDALDRLPQTLCHNDAFRRNLFARRGADGQPETVAIDWAFVGTGAVGQDLGPLVAGTLEFQEVDIAHAAQLDAIVFDGYLNGLRAAGWHDDPRKVRFAYAAAAPFIYELGCAALLVEFLTQQDGSVEQLEHGEGTADELIHLMGQSLGFRLRLADEARTLLNSVS